MAPSTKIPLASKGRMSQKKGPVLLPSMTILEINKVIIGSVG
jgi:hypothetical protein